jgi:hypothetical protein
MTFTAEQNKAIEITERVCSGISLLCSCSIIATFFLSDHFQTPVHRLIFFASWGNLWSNVAMMIALSGIQRGGDSALCQFQGLLIQWSLSPFCLCHSPPLTARPSLRFTPADAFWSLCMACDILLTCWRRYDTEMLRRLEWKYFLFSYGMPFIPAFVFLFIETNARGKIYGSAFVSKLDFLHMYEATDSAPRFGVGSLLIGVLSI